MKKDEIEEVKLTLENSQGIFRDYFIEGIKTGKVYTEKEYIVMETEKGKIKVDFKRFTNVYRPTFERIFSKELLERMGKERITFDNVEEFYIWNHPIFDEISYLKGIREATSSTIRSNLDSDEEYKDTAKEYVEEALDRRALMGLSIKEPADFFEEFDLVNKQKKIDLGYYNDASLQELKRLRKDGKLDDAELSQVVEISIVHESARKANNNQKRPSQRNADFANILAPNQILEMFFAGVITIDELAKTKVNKTDILNSDYIMYFAENRRQLPKSLAITSKDIVNNYGRSITGHNIAELIESELIEPEDVVDLASINATLRRTDYDKDLMFGDEEIDEFYSPKMIFALKMSDTLTPEFLEKYLKFMKFDEKPELLHKRSQELIKWIKLYCKNSEKIPEGMSDKYIQDYVLFFFDNKLCDLETAKENVTPEYIESQFLQEELGMEEVSRYHDRGLLDDDEFFEYFTSEELLEQYKQGKVEVTALKRVKDTQALVEMYADGKMPLKDAFKLYFDFDTLDIDNIETILILTEREVNVAAFVDEKTPLKKIKELFLHLIIDYASITEFLDLGYITEKEFNNLKDSLDTKELFESLRQQKVYTVVTDREGTGTGEPRPIYPRPNPIIEDEEEFRAEIDLLSRVLGIDLDVREYGTIRSFNAKGRATSLDKYRIYGDEETQIVVLRKSKKENAVFMMSAKQVVFFLKGEENEQGIFEIKDRMKDKAYLRSIRGVHRIEHDEFFGRNVVEAACEICPEVSHRLKDEKGQYETEVARMVKAMREQYLASKNKTLDED